MDHKKAETEIVASSKFFSTVGTARGLVTRSLSGPPGPQTASSFEAMLLAVAIHDLRQPLQAIQCAYDVLGMRLQTKSEQHLRQLGQTAIDQVAGQLSQLLGALVLYQKAKQIELSPVRIEPLLRQACLENEDTARRKGIGIRVVPTRALVMSDSLLLSAVLRNLVSNAIKYTKPGGRILLGCRRLGQTVRLDVLDTGIGIADGHMPRIFEAFTRLDSTQEDGLGIGLLIVRKAIGILRHRIEVSSVAGRGSRFSVFATVAALGPTARTTLWSRPCFYHRNLHSGNYSGH
jgi:two-component system phosphate regulon sensor histidine kinase PhoR